MGKWKALIPIFLALVIAATGSFVFYNLIENKTAPQETTRMAEKTVETVPVVVAATDLHWGTKLTKEMLKTVPFLTSSLPEGSFSDAGAIVGRVIISPLKGKDPITETRLAPEDVKVGGVSAVLKEGRRAVAVKGDKVVGLSGLVRPGNRVDILVTTKNPENKKDMTKLVLESVPVLATGTVTENKNGEPSPVDVYTLEVTPEQAERLALASNRGRLQFALRNITDSKSVKTKGAYIAETLNSLAIEKPAQEVKTVARSEPARPAGRTRYTVEVINGKNLVTKKF